MSRIVGSKLTFICAEKAIVRELVSHSRSFCKLATAILPLFPKPEFQRPPRKFCRRYGHVEFHQWCQCLDHFRCNMCLQFFEGPEDQLPMLGCAGVPRVLRRIQHAKLGHLIQARALKDRMIYVCARCGSWAEKRVRNLSQPCRGQARREDYGHAVLQRVAAGKPPQEPFKTSSVPTSVLVRDITATRSSPLPQPLKKGVFIRPPTPGGRLEAVVQRIRARL